MKMRCERRGCWSIWQGEIIVIGVNESVGVVELRNFQGRYTTHEFGSSPEILGDRMQALCETYLHRFIDDQLIYALMADAIGLLAMLKQEGMIIEIEPRFEHDCDECLFLGRSASWSHDLYFCDQQAGPFPTIIARYGSEGPQYKSGLIAALSGHDKELSEGLLFAVQAGLFLGREHILERMSTREQVDLVLGSAS